MLSRYSLSCCPNSNLSRVRARDDCTDLPLVPHPAPDCTGAAHLPPGLGLVTLSALTAAILSLT